MTKAELVERLSEKTKMSVQRAEFVVNALFACLEQAMRRGEPIEIRGFGTFQLRSYKGYEGRNPKTGEAILVPPKRLPFFKVSKNLASKIGALRGKTLLGEVPGAKLMLAGVVPLTPGGQL